MIARSSDGACAIALIAATAVLAQPAQSGGKAGANKQICRTMTDTGSRLSRNRACHTAEEWAELRRQTKQNVDRIQNARSWNDAN